MSIAQRRQSAVTMAGRIGSVQKAKDGQSYGFVIYDMQDRACVHSHALRLAEGQHSMAQQRR